ncbi:Uncharacterised protein [Candidatus Norongarragalina meridionalis]|nr:Uncharacterised protein [Candidatus Norongarragalina meridionalis]
MTTIVAALVVVSFASLAGLALGVSGGEAFSITDTEARDNAFAFEDARSFYAAALADCAADAAYASWGCAPTDSFCGYFEANLPEYFENATERLNANATHVIGYLLGDVSCKEVTSDETGAAYAVSAALGVNASSANVRKSGSVSRAYETDASLSEYVFRTTVRDGETAVAEYAVQCPTPSPTPRP